MANILAPIPEHTLSIALIAPMAASVSAAQVPAPTPTLAPQAPAPKAATPQKRVLETGAPVVASSKPIKRRRGAYIDVRDQLAGLERLIKECKGNLVALIRVKISLEIDSEEGVSASSKEEEISAQQVKVRAKTSEIAQLISQKNLLEEEVELDRVRRERETQETRRGRARRRAPPRKRVVPKPVTIKRISEAENYEMWFTARHGPSFARP